MRLSLKKIRNLIIALAVLLLAGQIGYWLGRNDVSITKADSIAGVKVVNKTTPAGKADVDFSLFWEVWDRLEQTYLEKGNIDPEKMVYGAIEGMTASIKDPYTVFLPPSDNEFTKEDLNGSFEGVGIQLGYNDENLLTVVAPLSGTPAEKAGVRAGDLILHIKDEANSVDQETLGMSLPEAVKLIRGPKGSSVILTMLHESSKEPVDISIQRGTIVVPSVEVKFGYLDSEGRWQESGNEDLGKRIAWLRLTRFGDLTDSQWDESIQKITTNCGVKSSGCQTCGSSAEFQCLGIILDLRNNPGGYLEGPVKLAGDFLPFGSVVVKQENSDGSILEYKTDRPGRLLEVPLAVLVNKGSASASEIFAGALRDNNRAKIVGEETFGKGTIQEAVDLRDGSGLHVTIAKWLFPSGSWLNKQGLKTDIEIKNDENDNTRDLQLEKAAEELSK